MTLARKSVQAKDIPDRDVLRAVVELSAMHWNSTERANPPRWVFTSELHSRFDTFPPKVVSAKLAALVRRKLLDGCACGCRGDFVLTDAGRALLCERTTTP